MSSGCRHAVSGFGDAGREYVEDCKQETWRKLLESGPEYLGHHRSENVNSVHAFVKQVAFTTSMDYLRKQLGRFDQPPEGPGGDAAFVIDFDNELLLESIQKRLSATESSRNIVIFWLKHRDGMTPAQIASIRQFGLSRNGIETVLDRMLRDLKKSIRNPDPDPSPGGGPASKRKKPKDFGGGSPSHNRQPLEKNCPPSLDLVSLVHGDLEESRAEQIYLHLAECAACGGILRNLVRLEDRGNVIPWPSILKIAAVLTLFTAGSFYAWKGFRPQSPASYLAEAYTKARPFDWRLPDAGHGPVRVEMAESRTEISALQKAGIEVGKLEASSPGTPSTLAIRGRLALMRHDADGAVASLERAFSLAPGDAEIESELGVAYSLRARVADRPGDYQIAIGHFGHVLGRAPDNLHALFNRGVTYRSMGRRAEAALDFETYLKYDASSGWASEAREWLAQLKP